jgi:hypothetical protein
MVIDGATLAAIGVAINIMATLIGGVFFWGRVIQRIDEHAEARKVLTGKLETFIDTFQHAAINHARVETRVEHAETNILRLDRTVEDLRRGSGWMEKRDGLSGEYK